MQVVQLDWVLRPEFHPAHTQIQHGLQAEDPEIRAAWEEKAIRMKEAVVITEDIDHNSWCNSI